MGQAGPVTVTQFVNQAALAGRLKSFFDSTPCSIALSSDRSATSFLGLMFSSSNCLLPPALKAFHHAYPDVELKLFVFLTEEQAAALREERIHVGIGRHEQSYKVQAPRTALLCKRDV